jgi:hypothetical protein
MQQCRTYIALRSHIHLLTFSPAILFRPPPPPCNVPFIPPQHPPCNVTFTRPKSFHVTPHPSHPPQHPPCNATSIPPAPIPLVTLHTWYTVRIPVGVTPADELSPAPNRNRFRFKSNHLASGLGEPHVSTCTPAQCPTLQVVVLLRRASGTELTRELWFSHACLDCLL